MRFSPWLSGLKTRFAAGVGLLLMLVGTPFFYLFYTLHRDRLIDSLNAATTDMSRVLQADIWRMLGLAAIMLPVTLVAIAALMNWLVVGRVQALVGATNRVRRGDLTVTAPLSGDDEITVLAESFNAMTGTLRESIQEIERQRRYLELVIDSMEDQLCVVDSALRVVSANRSFVAAAGMGKGAIIGQPCAEVAHGGGAPCVACPAHAVFATGTVQKTHFVVPDSEGRERQYEVFCGPLRDGTGAVSRVIEVRRDVTERTSLEANLRHAERLASLGLLASGISHEINNPLASIAACVDGLKRQIRDRDGETEEGRALLEYLDLVSRETMRAKGITDRLLVLSRPARGLVSLVDLNTPILDTVSLLKFEAGRAGVILTPELQEALPPIVADEGQVRQLLLNLVLNAIQAAATGPHRPGRVSIKTCSTNGALRLSVIDNGPGIDSGDVKKIFEPFYSRRPNEQGTGLGLFIARTIVRGLHGTIRVSSRAGEGAAFIVEVPVHDPKG